MHLWLLKIKRLKCFLQKNNERGKGVGTKLIKYGITNFDINEVTVNEDNIEAIKFYKHVGFEVYNRSNVDEQGNNFLILYMRLNYNK